MEAVAAVVNAAEESDVNCHGSGGSYCKCGRRKRRKVMEAVAAVANTAEESDVNCYGGGGSCCKCGTCRRLSERFGS